MKAKTTILGVTLAVAVALVGPAALRGDDKAPERVGGDAGAEKPVYLPAEKSSAATDLKEDQLQALPLALPRAVIVGTPTKAPADTTVDLKTLGKKRGPFLVPPGVKLLSTKTKVTLSDKEPSLGDAAMVTDGSKEATEGDVVEMMPGLQWAQVDLEKPVETFAIVVWHFHKEPRIYRDVIVQVSDDPEFKQGVTTLFNNDQDNSAGLGAGKDREYFESDEGKLVDGRACKARYVRCYSKGNTSDGQNHLIEIEVWGK